MILSVFGRFGRLLVWTLLRHLALTLCAGILLFALVDAVEVGNLASDDSQSSLLRLSLFNLPYVALQIAPFCVALAALTAIATHRRDLESMMAVGAGPGIVLGPALLIAVVLAGAEFALTEWVVPPARTEVASLRRQLGLPVRAAQSMARTNTWMKSGAKFFRIDHLRKTDASELGGVLIVEISGNEIAARWDIHRLSFKAGAWTALGAVERRFGDGDKLKTQRHDQITMALTETPRDFLQSVGSPASLGFWPLSDAIVARQRLGQPTRRHRLERARRLGQPLQLVMILLLACAAGLGLKRRSTTAAALGVGAALALGAWLIEELGVALGSTGALAAEVGIGLVVAILAAGAATFWIRVFYRGIRE